MISTRTCPEGNPKGALAPAPKTNTVGVLIIARALYQKGSDSGINFFKILLGEALVGDITGRMSEQQYRTAKKQLSRFNIATFKPTNKGTIARLCDNSIYDINLNGDNEHDNRQPTSR
jgi:hypothetical protein